MPKELKVQCPECDKEVTLIDGEGECKNCTLDVGWVMERHRRDRALGKLKKRESEEDKKAGKKDRWSFD